MLTPLPPWHALARGVDRYLIRTIARFAVGDPSELKRLRCVDRMFHAHARCCDAVNVVACRCILRRWTRSSTNHVPERGFMTRVGYSEGVAVSAPHKLLITMETWARLGTTSVSHASVLSPRSREALNRIVQVCRRAQTQDTWEGRYSVLKQADLEMRRVRVIK